MIAAIYARKSTEQSGVADEQKSVARQVEHARAFAATKGWAVDEALVFVDDGISGAEFANRPGFLRLMNALKPRPAFQVLIMSEESRLGREAFETGYALKQLLTAGVRVFFYLEDRERTIETATDKLLMSVAAFADELEREKARQRTYDALARKARAGHVTGGRLFGYENRPVLGPDGRRSHVERAIAEAEAGVVRRIFQLCADGCGLRRIAVTLNGESAVSPRAQLGRPRSWAPSSVREVLYRETYRGVVVWNQSRKRDTWGRKAQHARPESEWMRTAAPSLQIVPEALWNAAHGRLTTARSTYLRGTDGRLFGKPQVGSDARYLLSGLMTCHECGGSLVVSSRQHGRSRAQFYVCAAHRDRGTCGNRAWLPMGTVDTAILDSFEQDLLTPARVAAAVAEARRALAAHQRAERASGDEIESRIRTLNGEIEQLTSALARGARLESILDALQARESERATLDARRREIARLGRSTPADDSMERLTQEIDTWRAMIRRNVPQGRQLLRKILVGRIALQPEVRGCVAGIRFAASAVFGRLFEGFFSSVVSVASPAGSPCVWTPVERWIPAA